jgi:glycerol kinase
LTSIFLVAALLLVPMDAFLRYMTKGFHGAITHLIAGSILFRVTGKAYHNALVWNDTRTADICDALAATDPRGAGDRDRFRASTGLPLSPYFSGSKMMYLLDKVRLPVLEYFRSCWNSVDMLTC